jgi:hypothetical protein
MSGSRSIAAARSRRAGEQANIVSGGRPVTSIASQSAFANQPYAQQQQQQNRGGRGNGIQQQQQQHFQQQQQPPSQQQKPSNNLPFTKLSISDAIGLITLRLGRVEQFMIDTEGEPNAGNSSNNSLSDNSKIIDSSLLTSIINRLDSLEKKEQQISSLDKLVLHLQTELNTSKETVLNLTSQVDAFIKDTTDKLTDFELGITEIENVVYVNTEVSKLDNNESENGDLNNTPTSETLNDANENTILSVDLKSIIKEELSRTSE